VSKTRKYKQETMDSHDDKTRKRPASSNEEGNHKKAKINVSLQKSQDTDLTSESSVLDEIGTHSGDEEPVQEEEEYDPASPEYSPSSPSYFPIEQDNVPEGKVEVFVPLAPPPPRAHRQQRQQQRPRPRGGGGGRGRGGRGRTGNDRRQSTDIQRPNQQFPVWLHRNVFDRNFARSIGVDRDTSEVFSYAVPSHVDGVRLSHVELIRHNKEICSICAETTHTASLCYLYKVTPCTVEAQSNGGVRCNRQSCPFVHSGETTRTPGTPVCRAIVSERVSDRMYLLTLGCGSSRHTVNTCPFSSCHYCGNAHATSTCRLHSQ